MGKVEKVSISLSEELGGAVRKAVDSGRYASASEVVREALRDWTEKQDRRHVAAAKLRELWDEGVASGDFQEAEPIDAFLARNRARLGDHKE